MHYTWDANPDRHGDVAEIARFLEIRKRNVETERRLYETPAVQFTDEQQNILDYR